MTKKSAKDGTHQYNNNGVNTVTNHTKKTIYNAGTRINNSVNVNTPPNPISPEPVSLTTEVTPIDYQVARNSIMDTIYGKLADLENRVSFLEKFAAKPGLKNHAQAVREWLVANNYITSTEVCEQFNVSRPYAITIMEAVAATRKDYILIPGDVGAPTTLYDTRFCDKVDVAYAKIVKATRKGAVFSLKETCEKAGIKDDADIARVGSKLIAHPKFHGIPDQYGKIPPVQYRRIKRVR